MTQLPARWFDRKMKGRKIWLTRDGSCLFFCPYLSANLLHATARTELEPEGTYDFLALTPCGWRAVNKGRTIGGANRGQRLAAGGTAAAALRRWRVVRFVGGASLVHAPLLLGFKRHRICPSCRVFGTKGVPARVTVTRRRSLSSGWKNAHQISHLHRPRNVPYLGQSAVKHGHSRA